MNVLRRLSFAISYVTSIKLVPDAAVLDESGLYGLAKFLPTVGLLLGAVLSALAILTARLHVSSLLSASLLTLGWLWLTGGLHMDGLMDATDGIFSHRSKERILEIMRDSRVGNFGVLSAISVLIPKILALATFTLPNLCVVLLLAPALGRALEVYAIGRFEYARFEGKGKIWHDTTVFPRDLFVSLLPLAAVASVCCLVCPKLVLVTVLSAAVAGSIAAHWLNKKIDGHTGDTYGAVVEVTELIAVVAAAICGS